MTSWVRHLGEGLPRRSEHWVWAACGVFALVVVLSAGSRVTLTDGPPAPQAEPYYVGEELRGTRGADVLRGTRSTNLIFGFGGSDSLYGGADADLIDPGNGDDYVSAGAGDDRVRALDGDRDVIDCGPGQDIAFVDARDVTRHCEELRRWIDTSLPATPEPS